MKKLLWLGGAVVLAAAAAGVWWAFQSPTFVSGLVVLAAGAIWKAILPSLRASPETVKLSKRAARENTTVEELQKRPVRPTVVRPASSEKLRGGGRD